MGSIRFILQALLTAAPTPWLNCIRNVFILLYLLFAVFWDSPESTLVGRNLKLLLRPFITRAGLSYRWNMYSGPFTDIVEIEVRARNSDGTMSVIPLPPRYEFRRYCFMLSRQRRDDLFQGFAKFIESQFARDASPPVEIVVVRRVTKVQARPGRFRAHFDVRIDPEFRETLLAKRILQ